MDEKTSDRSKKLVLLIGYPYSGKSTFAHKQGCPVVCPDDIRMALHGYRYIALSEPFVWAIAQVMVRALFLTGHDKVVLDACNNTKKRRDVWVPNDLWDTQLVFVNTPKEECIERAQNCGDYEIIPVIECMAEERDLNETDFKDGSI